MKWDWQAKQQVSSRQNEPNDELITLGMSQFVCCVIVASWDGKRSYELVRWEAIGSKILTHEHSKWATFHTDT